MIEVRALKKLDHNTPRRRGETFHVSPQIAAKLIRKGAVELADSRAAADPHLSAGAPSSALPADPASQQTTSAEFLRGETRRKPRRKADEE